VTAALALRRVGIDAQVYERVDSLSKIQTGLAIVLWSNAMRALRYLGLDQQIEAASSNIERVKFRSSSGEMLADWPVGDMARKYGMPNHGIMRAELARILFEALEDGVLQLGRECTGFHQDESGVTVHFADGQDERGDVLIGADGLRSVIRTQLLGNMNPRYAGYTAYPGSVVNDVADAHVFHDYFGSGLRFLFFRIREKTFWVAVVGAPEGGTGIDKQELMERYRNWIEPVPTLIAAADESAMMRLDGYDRNPLKRWGEGRVTLLGDAAHPMTFNVGQGACQAIESGIVIANCLSGEDNVVSALRQYEAQRTTRTGPVVLQARRVGLWGTWHNPLVVAGRDQFMKFTLNKVAIKMVDYNMGFEVVPS
jgi:2-polyprenyl-6-methoxyphenol hydroxylase-like FAD-dependent oxidoreductase